MKRLLQLYLFLLFTNAVSSQQLSFIKYSVYDGLVANPVRCIYQDSKGFIWIGTVEGLSRYDGYRFTNYTTSNGLSHDYINAISESDDKLLVAVNNGAIDIFVNNALADGYKASSAINYITRVGRDILLTSDAAGFYFYKNGYLIHPRQKRLNYALGAMLPLGDSLFLAAGVDNYFFIYSRDLNIISKSPYHQGHVFSLFQDSKKRIWACTSFGLCQLSVSSSSSHEVTIYEMPEEFRKAPVSEVPVTSILEQEDGSFWIGSYKGLIHLFPDGKFRVYNEKDGLPSARIQCLFEDKEKNLWIGTSLGLAKWVAKNDVIFFNTETQDFRNDVIALASSGEKKIVLRTDHGLQYFDEEKKSFTNILVPGNFQYPVPVAGTSPLLINYLDNIGVLDIKINKVKFSYKLDTALAGIVSAVQGANGTLYFGTFAGLFASKGSRVTKILQHRITTLAADMEGSVWVGCWDTGLFSINEKEGKFQITDLTSTIKQTHIRGLYVDNKKNIWVGSRYGGAFCFTPTGNGSYSIQKFNRQQGLLSDWVSCFAETDTDDIWVGSQVGLDKLVKEKDGYRIFNFSKAVNFFAEIKKMLPIKKNEWICLANTGIGIFNDEALHQQRPIQPVIFTASLGVLENKKTFVLPAQRIAVKPYQNAASFEFGALGFMNERQMMYSYRLRGGGDSSWSKPENVHEASYASLSPGNYFFEVKTLGWNGQFSPVASFSFFIKTPFWKTWWFISLCALLIMAIIYAFYRYRIKQLMHLQQVRNSIATDLHDEIGSALTNISILAELSRNKERQAEQPENLPLRIAEESTLAQQALDDIIWSVNTSNDTLNQTTARMRRYAAEVFEPIGINCRMDIFDMEEDVKLNMEQRKDIYLVFKESLNNIIKHAAAKNVFIKIELLENILHIRIEDDGKGFDITKQTDRNGLKNMRKRIQRWNSQLEMHSAPGRTVIECKLALAKPD